MITGITRSLILMYAMPPLEVHESLETGMKRSLRFPQLFGVSQMAHPSMVIRRKMFRLS